MFRHIEEGGCSTQYTNYFTASSWFILFYFIIIVRMCVIKQFFCFIPAFFFCCAKGHKAIILYIWIEYGGYYDDDVDGDKFFGKTIFI